MFISSWVESISQSDLLNRPLGLSPSILIPHVTHIKKSILELREMWIGDGENKRIYEAE